MADFFEGKVEASFQGLCMVIKVIFLSYFHTRAERFKTEWSF